MKPVTTAQQAIDLASYSRSNSSSDFTLQSMLSTCPGSELGMKWIAVDLSKGLAHVDNHIFPNRFLESRGSNSLLQRRFVGR